MIPFFRLATEFNIRFVILEKEDCPLSINAYEVSLRRESKKIKTESVLS
jgi:hypothetical protein